MNHIDTALFIIRLGIGFNMICFGLMQFSKPQWWAERYVPAWASKILPITPATFMRVHSFGNLSLGFLFVIGVLPSVVWPLVLAWWLFVTPFAFRHDKTEGLRDISIACAVIAAIVLHSGS